MGGIADREGPGQRGGRIGHVIVASLSRRDRSSIGRTAGRGGQRRGLGDMIAPQWRQRRGWGNGTQGARKGWLWTRIGCSARGWNAAVKERGQQEMSLEWTRRRWDMKPGSGRANPVMMGAGGGLRPGAKAQTGALTASILAVGQKVAMPAN